MRIRVSIPWTKDCVNSYVVFLIFYFDNASDAYFSWKRCHLL